MHITKNIKQKSVMARIMRNSTMHQKNFSLVEYKSWEAAEKAAKIWITEIKAQLPEPRSNEVGRMTSRNSSGFVGVWLSKTVRKMKNGNKHTYWAWKSKWPECSLSGGLSWPITESLTDDDAFILAVLARQLKSVDRPFLKKQLLKVYGSDAHYDILSSKKNGPK